MKEEEEEEREGEKEKEKMKNLVFHILLLNSVS